jgi:DNA processing protein
LNADEQNNFISLVKMEEILKSAVALSILSAPVKLGLWDTLSLSPSVILKKIEYSDLRIQEIINYKYPGNAEKAAGRIIEICRKKNIRIITIWDPSYPRLLKEIHNPPLVIYSSGDLSDRKMISVVGTRDSDEKSEEITKKISERAALHGYTIVSGMAMGIDRNAHKGALMAGGGTVAVLPGGVDVIYPYKNSDLYRMILKSELSAVISEYPPGTGTAQKWTFARRNRIISGLSEAVIVVQAPAKSGAMITARYAIEQNRDLFVCPGNAFDEKYSGCHELIRQGAAVFSDMSDLFAEAEPDANTTEDQCSEKKEINKIKGQITGKGLLCDTPVPDEITGRVEIRIFEEIKSSVIEVDEFIRRNNFSADEVNQGITILEISGYIERKGNRLYKLL